MENLDRRDIKTTLPNKNMEAFKKAGMCFELPQQNSPHYLAEEAKNGEKILKACVNGKWKYVHSKFDPAGEGERLSQQIHIKRKTVVVCFGMGFLYHIKPLLGRLGEDNEILIYEPSPEIFRLAVENVDLTEIVESKKVTICLSPNEDDYWSGLIKSSTWASFEEMVTLAPPVYKEAFAEEYRQFLQVYKRFYNAKLINRNTALMYVEEWQQKGLVNARHIINTKDYACLLTALKGVPVVLVSAGPSLNKNIHLLKEIKGKFLILCVYTAFKVMQKAGIEPDLVISLDSNQTMIEDEEIKKQKIDIPLICNSFTDPLLLSRITGDTFFVPFYSDHIMLKLAEKCFGEDSVIIETGGSVACGALDFCYKAGCDPIILIGQDLAYTGEKTHAVGTYYDHENKLREDKSDYLVVEGINGEKLYTDNAFYSFLTWFNSYITAHGGEREFIDATEGGAKIDGTLIMTFREAIDKAIHKAADIEAIFSLFKGKQFLLNPMQKLDYYNDINKSVKNFEESKEYLPQCIDLVKKLVKIYEDKADRIKSKAIRSYLRKLDEYDKKLNDFYVHDLYMSVSYKKVSYALESIDRDGEMGKDLYILNKNLAMYEGLLYVVDSTLPFLKQAGKEVAEALAQEKIL